MINTIILNKLNGLKGGGFKFSRPMNFVNKYGIEFVDID